MAKIPIFNPTEDVEATRLVEWAKLHRWHGRPISELLIMIPNGAYLGANRTTRAIVMSKLKRAGFRNGVSDYLLPIPTIRGCPGLWIELKRRKGGQLSPEQLEFGNAMEAFGWSFALAKGWEKAALCIENHLASCALPQAHAMLKPA